MAGKVLPDFAAQVCALAELKVNEAMPPGDTVYDAVLGTPEGNGAGASTFIPERVEALATEVVGWLESRLGALIVP
jgi:hypothetical protein